MKKKALLIVFTIALLSIVLAGCISKPPHKILSDPWGNYEQITYEVTRTLKDDTKIKGVSTLTTERITDGSIKVGEREINNFSGTFVQISTTLDYGSIMIGQVAFKASFEPVASYKEINIKGYSGNSPEKDTKQITDIYYNDEKCYYKTDFDGVITEDNIKTGKWIKKPFYDNLMLYHVARSSYLDGNFSATTTKVLSTSNFKMKTLTVSNSLSNQLTKIFGDDDEGIKADTVSLTLNQTFPGSGAPMVVTLSRETKENYNGLNLNTERVPLLIFEGDMEYKISNYKTEK